MRLPFVKLLSRSGCYWHQSYRGHWFLDPRSAFGRSLAPRVLRPAPRRGTFGILGPPLVELRSSSRYCWRPPPPSFDRRLTLLGFAPLQRNPDARIHHPRAYHTRFVPTPGLSLGTPSCRLPLLTPSRRCSRRRAHGVPPSGLFPSHGAATRFRVRSPHGGWLPKRDSPRYELPDGPTATYDPRIVD